MVTKKIRNFLWTGSCEETKLVRVAWNRCCRPYALGGLGWYLAYRGKLPKGFWHDNWLGIPILDLLRILDFLATHLQAKIGRIAISSVIDYLVWPHARDGSVSCKAAYSRMFHDIPQVPWWRDVWSRYIPPSSSILSKRILLDRLPTEDRLCRSGFQLASRAALSLVWHYIYDANHLGIGYMRNCVDDLLILHRFGLSGRSGVGGCGGVFQTWRSFVKACFAVPLGQVFAFEAELLAASLAINYA
ncbi:hypothetical protein Dsin_032048 [Dipteronia sinensis]|uniref:Reverse transcriptase zinc-binding domain-containing protein n=1 Tax=Dipteronia sinensis TaxID=43782 RepID=A0AAD9ZMT9_9ROSI|nr:hypothetical protein Dsin_032048 [Dipteronia sinensis]